jgi:hypothetical protein
MIYFYSLILVLFLSKSKTLHITGIYIVVAFLYNNYHMHPSHRIGQVCACVVFVITLDVIAENSILLRLFLVKFIIFLGKFPLSQLSFERESVGIEINLKA